jgi:hypothetical protein
MVAENALGPILIGRKTWLFAGTTRGVYVGVACYLLIETAEANNLELYVYI